MYTNYNKDTVLIVDDRKEDFDLISNCFIKYKIECIYANSTEEMEDKLKYMYMQLTAIVLDIVGFQKKSQNIENSDFLSHTIGILNRSSLYQGIKIFIASGSPDDYDVIKKAFKDYEVFTKDNEQLETLAKKIKEVGLKKDETIIINRHDNLFEAIKKCGLEEFSNSIIEILKDISQNNKQNITEHIATIRRIHERIYKSVNEMFNLSQKNNFSSINRILAGNRNYNNKAEITTEYYYNDRLIEQANNTIHWVGSYHGSHDNKTLNVRDIDTINFPTIYTLRTLVYSLMEIIFWYSRIYYTNKNKS